MGSLPWEQTSGSTLTLPVKTRFLFSLTIPGDPIPKGRPRFTLSGRTYTPERTRVAESTIRTVARRDGIRAASGPLFVAAAFYMKPPQKRSKDFPTHRPDVDNLIKMLDALNGIAFKDDAQIVGMMPFKLWSDGDPYTKLSFYQVTL